MQARLFFCALLQKLKTYKKSDSKNLFLSSLLVGTKRNGVKYAQEEEIFWKEQFALIKM